MEKQTKEKKKTGLEVFSLISAVRDFNNRVWRNRGVNDRDSQVLCGIRTRRERCISICPAQCLAVLSTEIPLSMNRDATAE